MYKEIIFRVDAAKLSTVGTGNLYRSIFLSNKLKKKFKLKKNNILFLTKTTNEYSISKKILLQNKINFKNCTYTFKDYSLNELNLINNYKSNLLIIDKYMKKISKKFILKLKQNHKKILLIDDISSFRNLCDLSVNPMSYNIPNLRIGKIGYKYNILPSYDFISKKRKKIVKKKFFVFLFFGGYDKKKITIKILNKFKNLKLNLKFFVNKNFKNRIDKRFIKNLNFFDYKNHFEKLYHSDLSINNGGLAMMDAIIFKKPTICIPQYKHQKINIENLNKSKAVFFSNLNDTNKIVKIIKNVINKKINLKQIQLAQNKIINLDDMNKTLNIIYKLYFKKNI